MSKIHAPKQEKPLIECNYKKCVKFRNKYVNVEISIWVEIQRFNIKYKMKRSYIYIHILVEMIPDYNSDEQLILK